MKTQRRGPFGWTMAIAMLAAIALTASSLGALPAAAPAAGDWRGALLLPDGASLAIVLHVSLDNSGKLNATMDSPDQNVNGIVVTKISYVEPDLHFEVGSIGGLYDGKMNGDNSKIAGEWQQSGMTLALTLTRTK